MILAMESAAVEAAILDPGFLAGVPRTTGTHHEAARRYASVAILQLFIIFKFRLKVI